jgi:hypothetical protein
MRSLGIFLFATAFAIGCNRVGPNGASAPGAVPATDPEANYPTRSEIIDYLDGKTMPSRVPADPKDAGILIRRDQIDALEVEKRASRINDGPWSTDVTFLLKTPDGKYAVRATVEHRRVEGKRAFFGIDFREVAKQ